MQTQKPDQLQQISIDEFRSQIRAARPTCEICQFKAHSLIGHLRDKHQLSPGQYKKRYPLSAVTSTLVEELLRTMDRTAMVTTPSLADLLPKFTGRAVDDIVIKDWKEKLDWYSPPPETLMYIPEADPRFKFTKNAGAIALAFWSGRNLLTSGPTGCGKTEEIKQVMNRLGVPLRRANMHGDVTYGTFVGCMKADINGTFFDYGLLPHAMRNGYPILLDEIDFTPPNIAAVMFPVLEKDSELYIPETGEHIKPVRGFNVFATGNTGGKGDGVGSYTGTEILNSAFLDRFSLKLLADYLPPATEIALLGEVSPQFREEFLAKVVAFATEIRIAFEAGDLAFTWSTRKVIDYVTLLDVLEEEEALDVTLRNWLDESDRPFVDNLYKKVGLSGFKRSR